jgi:hypothetical protein
MSIKKKEVYCNNLKPLQFNRYEKEKPSEKK